MLQSDHESITKMGGMDKYFSTFIVCSKLKRCDNISRKFSFSFVIIADTNLEYFEKYSNAPNRFEKTNLASANVLNVTYVP